jgi:hypothetical protein
MKVKLKIIKTLDDNLIISDHPKLIIFVSPKANKILATPKAESLDQDIFLSERRMFDYFVSRGIIDPSSIKGGAVYKSMEADYFNSEKVNPLNAVLKCIYDYVQTEIQYHDALNASIENYEDGITDPSEKDSTELGEFPAEDEAGNMPKYPMYSDTFWGYNL